MAPAESVGGAPPRRALIVGAGGFSRGWARTRQDSARVTVAGWVDIRPGAAEQAARELELAGIYTGTDLEKALSSVGPDFVLDVVAPAAHHEVAVQALEAGLPVLCEKPMADSMEHARAMIAAADRAGKLLMISQQRTYNRGFGAMRRLIVEQLGPPSILNSDFYIAHPEAGFHQPMPDPLLLDMAIHTFDAARFVSGADPVAVYCEEFNAPWSWFSGLASATALFEMTGGLHYTYLGSWTSQGRHTTWESEWRAVGPNGTLTWDGESPPVAEIVTVPGEFPHSGRPLGLTRVEGMLDPSAPQWLEAPLRDFLRALDTGSTPWGECHDNIKSLAMVFGAIESARTGTRVSIEP